MCNTERDFLRWNPPPTLRRVKSQKLRNWLCSGPEHKLIFWEPEHAQNRERILLKKWNNSIKKYISFLQGSSSLTLEALRGGGGGGGGRSNWSPPSIFLALDFAPWPIVKSFGTTVPCLWTHLFTLIKWRHKWWQYRKKSRNLCVDFKISIFR